jgi:hypothetical protein
MPPFGFFRKKPEEPQELQSFDVSLADLPEWFDRAMGEEIKKKSQETEGIYSSVLESFSNVRQSLDRLDRARMAGGERVHVAANMIKDSFVRKNYNQLSTLASFYQQHRPDYEYFMQFHERGANAIKGLKESTPKQAILLSRYFKRESGEVVDSIKRSEELLQQLLDFLKAGSGALGTKERVRAMARACNGLLAEREELDERASGLRDEAERLKKRKSELEKEFLELLKSSEWNELNRLKKEVADVRKEFGEAELRMTTELSSLKKPLKRLEHSMARAGRLTPIQKNTLQDFIRNPLKAMVSEKGERELHKALKSLMKQIDSRNLEIRGNEHLGVDELLGRLEGDMPALKSRYTALKSRLERAEGQLNDLSRLTRNKDGLEAQIGRVSEESGSIEDELREIASRKSRAGEQLKERISEMESVILEETQKRVTIRL